MLREKIHCNYTSISYIIIKIIMIIIIIIIIIIIGEHVVSDPPRFISPSFQPPNDTKRPLSGVERHRGP